MVFGDAQEMGLRAPLPGRFDQPGFFQYVEMLGNRLARQGDPIFGHRPSADFEQRLTRLLAQTVDYPTAGAVGEGFEKEVELVFGHCSPLCSISTAY